MTLPKEHNIFKDYLNKYFVETGSLCGDGILKAIEAGFENIISIELSEKHYNFCVDKFKNIPYVKLIKGDSGKILYDIIININEPITFWLDGHYSGDNTAKSDLSMPIINYELEQISKHSIKNHTIIIDDLRGMNKKEIENMILQNISNDYKFIYLDSKHAKEDIMVAQNEKNNRNK
jgi:hypothetical protein